RPRAALDLPLRLAEARCRLAERNLARLYLGEELGVMGLDRERVLHQAWGDAGGPRELLARLLAPRWQRCHLGSTGAAAQVGIASPACLRLRLLVLRELDRERRLLSLAEVPARERRPQDVAALVLGRDDAHRQLRDAELSR